MLYESNCHVFSKICHDGNMKNYQPKKENIKNCHARHLPCCWRKLSCYISVKWWKWIYSNNIISHSEMCSLRLPSEVNLILPPARSSLGVGCGSECFGVRARDRTCLDERPKIWRQFHKLSDALLINNSVHRDGYNIVGHSKPNMVQNLKR